MIFKIQRVNQSNYFKHRETGEIRRLENVPYHYYLKESTIFLGVLNGYYDYPDEWQAMPGPMPISGAESDVVEVNTIGELCKLVRTERHPIMITLSNKDCSVRHCGIDGTWTLFVCDGPIE